MSDDEGGSFAARRRRRQRQDSDEEETPSFASRKKQDSDEDEAPAPTRTFGRKDTSEEEEEEESKPVVNNHVSVSSTPGTAFSKLPEAKRNVYLQTHKPCRCVALSPNMQSVSKLRERFELQNRYIDDDQDTTYTITPKIQVEKTKLYTAPKSVVEQDSLNSSNNEPQTSSDSLVLASAPRSNVRPSAITYGRHHNNSSETKSLKEDNSKSSRDQLTSFLGSINDTTNLYERYHHQVAQRNGYNSSYALKEHGEITKSYALKEHGDITKYNLSAKNAQIVNDKRDDAMYFNKKIYDSRKKLYENYLSQKKQLFEIRNSTAKAIDDISNFKKQHQKLSSTPLVVTQNEESIISIHERDTKNSIAPKPYNDTNKDLIFTRHYSDTNKDSIVPKQYNDMNKDSIVSKHYNDTNKDSIYTRHYNESNKDSIVLGDYNDTNIFNYSLYVKKRLEEYRKKIENSKLANKERIKTESKENNAKIKVPTTMVIQREYSFSKDNKINAPTEINVPTEERDNAKIIYNVGNLKRFWNEKILSPRRNKNIKSKVLKTKQKEGKIVKYPRKISNIKLKQTSEAPRRTSSRNKETRETQEKLLHISFESINQDTIPNKYYMNEFNGPIKNIDNIQAIRTDETTSSLNRKNICTHEKASILDEKPMNSSKKKIHDPNKKIRDLNEQPIDNNTDTYQQMDRMVHQYPILDHDPNKQPIDNNTDTYQQMDRMVQQYPILNHDPFHIDKYPRAEKHVVSNKHASMKNSHTYSRPPQLSKSEHGDTTSCKRDMESKKQDLINYQQKASRYQKMVVLDERMKNSSKRNFYIPRSASADSAQAQLLQKKVQARQKYSYDIHGRRIFITPNGTSIPVRYLQGEFVHNFNTSIEDYWDYVNNEAWRMGARDFNTLRRRNSRSPTTCIKAMATPMEKDIYFKAEEKIQLQLIEGMFKYAESKYGRKRAQRGEKQNPMEDYDLYLRSVKAKVKAATDKLNTALKQKKDIDAKVAAAEKEQQLLQSKYDKADEEKNNAVNEGRDPVLPKDFIVPQRAKKANAGLGALVMKASSQMWEDKFSAMRSKKTSSNTPEWLAKQKKSDKTHAILSVGKKKKTEKDATPSFGAKALKKSDTGRRRKKDEEPPNPFKVNLKKTGLRQEEEEEKKPAARKTFTKTKEPSIESEPEPEPEPEQEPEPEPEQEPEPEPTPEPQAEEEEDEDMPIRRRRVRRVYDSDEE